MDDALPPVPARRVLNATEIVTALSRLEGWTLAGEGDAVAIQKTWRFANFHETMAFVNAVAFIAHREDHHPELSVHYGSCTVRFSTHQPKGLTALDFASATRVDALHA